MRPVIRRFHLAVVLIFPASRSSRLFKSLYSGCVGGTPLNFALASSQRPWLISSSSFANRCQKSGFGSGIAPIWIDLVLRRSHQIQIAIRGPHHAREQFFRLLLLSRALQLHALIECSLLLFAVANHNEETFGLRIHILRRAVRMNNLWKSCSAPA